MYKQRSCAIVVIIFSVAVVVCLKKKYVYRRFFGFVLFFSRSFLDCKIIQDIVGFVVVSSFSLSYNVWQEERRRLAGKVAAEKE